MSDRLQRTLAHLDALHAADPARVVVDGEELPAERAWASRVGTWLVRLAPEATVPLRLAASCQHLERWTLPRASYPAGRAGYHAWRRAQARRQSRRAKEVLAACGWDDATAERVAALVRKENRAGDPEAQALEDAACLAFLELELERFAAGRAADDVVRVLARTWRKMSPAGHDAARRISLGANAGALLERALDEHGE